MSKYINFVPSSTCQEMIVTDSEAKKKLAEKLKKGYKPMDKVGKHHDNATRRPAGQPPPKKSKPDLKLVSRLEAAGIILKDGKVAAADLKKAIKVLADGLNAEEGSLLECVRHASMKMPADPKAIQLADNGDVVANFKSAKEADKFARFVGRFLATKHDIGADIKVTGMDVVVTKSSLGALSYNDADLQNLGTVELVNLIREKKVTYRQVDTALEKIKAFQKLDKIGDMLAKDELKGKGVSDSCMAALATAGVVLRDGKIAKADLDKATKALASVTADYDYASSPKSPVATHKMKTGDRVQTNVQYLSRGN